MLRAERVFKGRSELLWGLLGPIIAPDKRVFKEYYKEGQAWQVTMSELGRGRAMSNLNVALSWAQLQLWVRLDLKISMELVISLRGLKGENLAKNVKSGKFVTLFCFATYGHISKWTSTAPKRMILVSGKQEWRWGGCRDGIMKCRLPVNDCGPEKE